MTKAMRLFVEDGAVLTNYDTDMLLTDIKFLVSFIVVMMSQQRNII